MQIAARARSFLEGWFGRGQSAPAPTLNPTVVHLLPEPALKPQELTPAFPPEPTPSPYAMIIPARFQRPKKADRRDEAWHNRRGNESDTPLARLPMHDHVEGFLAFIGELEKSGELDLSGSEITRGKRWRGAFSDVLAGLYIEFCFTYWIEAYRWDGTNGFAQRLRQKLNPKRQKKLYAYTERQNEEARLVYFVLPESLPAKPKWFANRLAQLEATNVVPFADERRAA